LDVQNLETENLTHHDGQYSNISDTDLHKPTVTLYVALFRHVYIFLLSDNLE